MAITSTSRRTLLTAHVVVSVGWIGAVVSFLALNIVALSTSRAADARSMYVAMNVIGLYAIVPASLLTLGTGTAQSLATQWGLWRHRWVATKLILAVGATAALLLHQFVVVRLAAEQAEQGTDPRALGTQLVVDASLAAAVLIVATLLSVFKPWGLTRHGQRNRDATTDTRGLSRSAKIGVAIAFVLLAAFVILHLAGGGMHHHGG